jgi:hypothetical protein
MCNTACESARAEDARRAKVGLLLEAAEEEVLKAEEASARSNILALVLAVIVMVVATACLSRLKEVRKEVHMAAKNALIGVAGLAFFVVLFQQAWQVQSQLLPVLAELQRDAEAARNTSWALAGEHALRSRESFHHAAESWKFDVRQLQVGTPLWLKPIDAVSRVARSRAGAIH